MAQAGPGAQAYRGKHAMGTSVGHFRVSSEAQWAEWNSAVHPYSVGVEEEVMLLDPQRRWALAPRIEDVLEMLPPALVGYVSAETHQAAIELRTDPHESVGTAIAQLHRLRVELVALLGRIRLAVAAAGAHPLALWSETEVTSASRYRLIRETMRDLTAREPTFALHVHVAVPEPERAIELYNRLRAHVPLLLALSGNSPFWRGRDAGSTRSCQTGRRAPARRSGGLEGVRYRRTRSQVRPPPACAWSAKPPCAPFYVGGRCNGGRNHQRARIAQSRAGTVTRNGTRAARNRLANGSRRRQSPASTTKWDITSPKYAP